MKTLQGASFLLLFAILLLIQFNISNAFDFCCTFDTNQCKWSDAYNTGSWTWSIRQTPNIDGISDYEINNTPNQWLQDKNITATETAVKVATVEIHENDSVSVDFYRHTPSDNADDKLKLMLQQNTGKMITLFSCVNQGWTSMSIDCKLGLCCSSYPCNVQIQIHGIIDNPNHLLAFDNFRINDCA